MRRIITPEEREYIKSKNIIIKSRGLPIYECIINSSWKEVGLANILISRQQPDGNLVFGSYLVDIFCLGLKDTFCNANFTLSRYENELKANKYFGEDIIDCPVSLAHQIIYGGIKYASKLGFKPQKDFGLSKYVLEKKSKIEKEYVNELEFGKDGKPFLFLGPYDDAELIAKKLKRNVNK